MKSLKELQVTCDWGGPESFGSRVLNVYLKLPKEIIQN
jgi:hypothetical protein